MRSGSLQRMVRRCGHLGNGAVAMALTSADTVSVPEDETDMPTVFASAGSLTNSLLSSNTRSRSTAILCDPLNNMATSPSASIRAGLGSCARMVRPPMVALSWGDKSKGLGEDGLQPVLAQMARAKQANVMIRSVVFMGCVLDASVDARSNA